MIYYSSPISGGTSRYLRSELSGRKCGVVRFTSLYARLACSYLRFARFIAFFSLASCLCWCFIVVGLVDYKMRLGDVRFLIHVLVTVEPYGIGDLAVLRFTLLLLWSSDMFRLRLIVGLLCLVVCFVLLHGFLGFINK